jgi:alpha-glucosidase (family GH31 glycosyl hydrolase)
MLNPSTFPYRPAFEPLAEPAAVVTGPQVRFTVLTTRLLRLEYSPSGVFEDHPSQAFWYRRQPAPKFKSRLGKKKIEIDTEHLHLTYTITPKGFRPTTLSVLVKATGQTWHYGDSFWRGGNLFGTLRTLDGTSGMLHLEPQPGLMGRAGWAAVDDSSNLVFDDQGWVARRAHPENVDLYLFGYGHAYADCLQDFSRLSGPTPLIPRWILGNWWSRYWAYTAEELSGVVAEFKEHDVPLGVCIVDMDWHITKTGNHSSGWTGYTWNRELFPDPPGFIAGLHAQGLRTALNLHPAEGVHPHEEQYPAMAQALGQDPAAGEPVVFDCANPRFMQAYFELLHHPQEAQGVDFWWLDWQQGQGSSLPGLDPLWWLNHLHFYDLGRDDAKRPFIFSRWGGLGNHRYPIGFSGDTYVTWESLAFQPLFTAAAANVGYGWWSHDIGGHQAGLEDDELYTRWVQWGAFSPILRLHSTSNPFHERRPWGRGPAAERAACAAMRLRHALIPYLYTMAWRNHTTALPLVLPMYYTHPEEEAAYQAQQQYWFGSELVAAPFVQPTDPDTGLARQNVWLPEGDWFDFFSGEYLPAGWRTVYGGLDDIPVFARAGAIVPLGPEVGWGGIGVPEMLRLFIFPGASRTFELCEDDGETTAYTRGAYAVTRFSQEWQPGELRFTIQPAAGDRSVIPAQRLYHLNFRGLARPDDFQVTLNGEPFELVSFYDEAADTLVFARIALTPADTLTVTLRAADLITRRDRSSETLTRLLRGFRLDPNVKYDLVREWPRIARGERSLHSFRGLNDAQLSVLQGLLK